MILRQAQGDNGEFVECRLYWLEFFKEGGDDEDEDDYAYKKIIDFVEFLSGFGRVGTVEVFFEGIFFTSGHRSPQRAP